MNGFFPTTGISVVKIDSEYPRKVPKGRVNVESDVLSPSEG